MLFFSGKDIKSAGKKKSDEPDESGPIWKR